MRWFLIAHPVKPVLVYSIYFFLHPSWRLSSPIRCSGLCVSLAQDWRAIDDRHFLPDFKWISECALRAHLLCKILDYKPKIETDGGFIPDPGVCLSCFPSTSFPPFFRSKYSKSDKKISLQFLSHIMNNPIFVFNRSFLLKMKSCFIQKIVFVIFSQFYFFSLSMLL